MYCGSVPFKGKVEFGDDHFWRVYFHFFFYIIFEIGKSEAVLSVSTRVCVAGVLLSRGGRLSLRRNVHSYSLDIYLTHTHTHRNTPTPTHTDTHTRGWEDKGEKGDNAGSVCCVYLLSDGCLLKDILHTLTPPPPSSLHPPSSLTHLRRDGGGVCVECYSADVHCVVVCL